MTLSEGLKSHFNSKQIRGGQVHFDAGRVALLHQSTDSASLEVRDRRKAYFVELSNLGESVRAHCECGTFRRGQLCGHLWAAILTLDDAGVAFSPPMGVWRQQLEKMIESAPNYRSLEPGALNTSGTELVYVLHTEDLTESDNVKIRLYERTRRKTGEWGKPRKYYVDTTPLVQIPDSQDREILALLGARQSDGGQWNRYNEEAKHAIAMESGIWDIAIPKIAATGRFFWRQSGREPLDSKRCLSWDGDEPYDFKLKSTEDDDGNLTLHGTLERREESIALDEPVLIFATSEVLLHDRMIRFSPPESFVWIRTLRHAGTISVPKDDRQDFSQLFASTPIPANSELADDIQFETITVSPVPLLRVKDGQRGAYVASVRFFYGPLEIEAGKHLENLVDGESRRVYRRDRLAEERCGETLELAIDEFCGSFYGSYREEVTFPVSTLPELANHLMELGWRVDVRGKKLHRAGKIHLKVASKVDWFELGGEVSFGDTSVGYPELLKAIRAGRAVVQLADGTTGLLPTEFLEQHRRFGELADLTDGTVRFQLSQAMILDSLLATQDSLRFDTDARFDETLKKVREFSGIHPRDEPTGFVGTLREYQKEGLGWLDFLKEFRFGGCLADDMGLGKTVQVLAMLVKHHRPDPKCESSKIGPSLVVAPKSLIFNWIEEAARFTPELKVLDYTGTQRRSLMDKLSEFDIVITTYGTLRRDIVELKDVTFDFAILDEAQAIKNHQSQTAKACRLITAKNRLAMTGTPVENHLGDLWSLFEFLNPGILGSNGFFQSLVPRAEASEEESSSLDWLSKGLRPYILRRTKSQVLDDLPEKLEQTLYCDMEPTQHKMYNELRDFFRSSLNAKIESDGLNRSKIHVLEALLRLRQVACHPALVDPKKKRASSAKLDLLVEQVREVTEEGHKALVFSQFTSFLDLVKPQLDKHGIVYEYLDGKTRKRAERVKRFQEDKDCSAFLISLKAGGHGLNLTAADYVFILDPWWNPAVEAQAIDRAHRIGQTKRVFAYRIICRNTVEDKILELQQRKKDLADAIITENNSVIRNLSNEDLAILLS
ncbi:MAG TPA: helicase SNF2 [Planctomycetaceae bacterium]|nr:helicase SNF2 [Planctomycetaceae bacterium]